MPGLRRAHHQDTWGGLRDDYADCEDSNGTSEDLMFFNSCININVGGSPGGGPAFDPSAQALFTASANAGFPYSDGRKTLVNNAFVALRSSTWLSRLGALAFLRAESEGQGLFDWLSATTYAVTGSLTFSSLGLTGTSGGYIDSGKTPSVINGWSLNSAMFAVGFSAIDIANTAGEAFSGSNNDADANYGFTNFGGSGFAAVNAVNSLAFPPPGAPVRVYAARMSASGTNLFYNSADQGLDPVAPVGVNSTNTLLFGGARVGGTVVDLIGAGKSMNFFLAGAGPANDADQAVLDGIISTYLGAF